MSTFDNKMLNGSNIMLEAVNAIRAKSDARRDIEAKVLAENNLGSKNQLFAGSLAKFNQIVDALVENKDADISLKIFDAQEGIVEVAKDARFTPRPLSEAYTKQDFNPEKNSTFMGAPKANPNKGGYSGGAKAVTKDGVTAMKRNKSSDEKKEDLGEEEGLQELSKKTLGSYIKKASHDVAHKGAITREFANRAAADRKDQNYVGGRKNAELSDKTFNKSWKRREGIAKAVDRITKEDTDLQELSRKTLGSYVSKAAPEIDIHSAKQMSHLNSWSAAKEKQRELAGKRGAVDKIKATNAKKDEVYHSDKEQRHMRKLKNRLTGVGRAADRLTKEDLDLQEISKQKAQQTYEKTGAALKKARESGDTETERKREKGNFMSYKRVTGAPTGKRTFGEEAEQRMEEIAETILAMEGLHSVDQLTESGFEKLEAIVEQVMIDEGWFSGGEKSKAKALTVSDKEAMASLKNSKAKPLLKSGADNKIVARQGRENIAYRKSMKGEEIVHEGWFSGGEKKKTPTPNPKGAPRGERDPGDYKNPTGWANKDVSQAVRNDRKLTKKHGGRFPDPNSY